MGEAPPQGQGAPRALYLGHGRPCDPLLLHPFACLVMFMEACICHSPERARYDGLGAKQDVGGLYSFMATHSLKWRPMRRRFPVSKPTMRPRALGGSSTRQG